MALSFTPEEIRDAAIAKWAATQERDNQARAAAREADRQRKIAQNQDRIPLVIGADPSLEPFAPFATATGVWIALPGCMPIRLDPNGGFSVCQSDAPERDSLATYACVWHLGEAIIHARREWIDLDEKNKRYAAEEAAREAESEAHKHDPKPDPERSTDERIAEALEGLLAAVKKFPVSRLP